MAEEVTLKLRLEGGQQVSSGIDKVNAQLASMAQKAQGASGSFKPLDPAAASMAKLANEAQRAGTNFRQFATSVEQSGSAVASSARSASSSVTSLASSVAVFAGAAGSITLAVRALDEFGPAASRIDLVSRSLEASARAQSELFKIAQESRVGYAGLADTYTALARAGNEMGVGQTRMLAITKSVSQAITISGGSAQSARAALIQLGQAMASGVLRGEELNSIMEQTPRLAQAIAEGMGKSVGELRKLGEEGKLTAEKVMAALEKSAPALAAEFNRIKPTISGAFEVFADGAKKAFYEFDKGAGISSALASQLTSLGKSLGEAGAAARKFGEDYGTAIKAVGEIALILAASAAISTLIGKLGALARFAASPITIAVAFVVTGYEAIEALGKSETGMRASLKNAENDLAALQKQARGSMLGGQAVGNADPLLDQRIKQAEQRVDALRAKLKSVAPPSDTERGASAQSLARRADNDIAAEEKAAIEARKRGREKAMSGYMDSVASSKQKEIKAEKERFASLVEVIGTSGADYEKALKAHNAKIAEINAKGGGGAGKKDDAAQRLIESLREQKAVLAAEAEATDGMSSSKRMASKIEEEFAAGTLKATDAQKAQIRTLLEENAVTEQSTKARREFFAGVERQEQANAKSRQATIDRINQLSDEAITAGLTESAIAALTVARLEEALAIARQGGATEDMLAPMEEELRLKRELLQVTEKAEVARDVSQTSGAKDARNAAKKALYDRQLAEGTLNTDTHKELVDKLKDNTDEMGEFMKQAAKNMQDAMAEFFIDPTAKGMQSIAEGFGKAVQKMIAQAAAAQLGKLLFGDLDKGGQMGGWIGKLFGSFSEGWSASAQGYDYGAFDNLISGFANGGIMTSAGPLKLNSYASGGIANTPQLSIFGEGRAPEAYVPLPDGKRIPVQMQGGGDSPNITVHVNSQTGDPAEIRRSAAAGARTALGLMSSSRRYA